MPRLLASLSLDLDNLWAYLRAGGDPAWQQRPSYLPAIVPRIVEFLGERGLAATVFVVGDDLARPADARAVEQLAAAGHEIASHGQTHRPWLDALPREQIEQEVVMAEEGIHLVTGVKPAGFRAAGFAWSPTLLEVLARRGYLYDASLFPTFIGPLARLYCRFGPLRHGRRVSENGDPRPPQRFSALGDALRPLRPHQVTTSAGEIALAPVTTFPLLRTPIHMTYLCFLAERQRGVALAYWRAALAACRIRKVSPSLLLHPLDFMGPEDAPGLAGFPGMRLARQRKLQLLADVLANLVRGRRVVTVRQHVADELQLGEAVQAVDAPSSAPCPIAAGGPR